MLTPPVAFLFYIALVGLLYLMGRVLAGPPDPSQAKSSVYASGESGPGEALPPGYRPFFRVALFFAVVHLGVIVLASGGASTVSAIYLLGIMVALVALILG